jgi:hypothetical protein
MTRHFKLILHLSPDAELLLNAAGRALFARSLTNSTEQSPS